MVNNNILLPKGGKLDVGYIQQALKRPEVLNALLDLQALEEVSGEEVVIPVAGLEIGVKDELMVHYFTDMGNMDTYGNILASYRLAYGRSAMYGEAVLAFEKPVVQRRVEQRMVESGLNDVVVNMEQLKLIKQDTDLGVKRQAISDYKKEKGKIENERVVLNIIDYSSLNENKDDNITVQLQSQDEEVSA